jgi:ketosteroid isomerase-like protein
METAPARESIARGRTEFVDALRRGDARAAAATYTTDAHLLAPSVSPIVGRDDIRAFWQAGIDAGVADVLLNADELSQSDGLAYETGAYAFRIGADGTNRVVERGHYVQVYQRQSDGTWQRTVEIFSPASGE